MPPGIGRIASAPLARAAIRVREMNDHRRCAFSKRSGTEFGLRPEQRGALRKPGRPSLFLGGQAPNRKVFECTCRKMRSMPTVLRIGPYRFHFYSREANERPHIHVAREDFEEKFWPHPVSLAANYGFSTAEKTHPKARGGKLRFFDRSLSSFPWQSLN